MTAERVWSVCPFFNERDVLEVRMREQAPVVDVFVVCEAPWTYAGRRKPVRLARGGGLQFTPGHPAYLDMIPAQYDVLREDTAWWNWLHELGRELGREVRVVVADDPPVALKPMQARLYPHAEAEWRRENHQRACLARAMTDVAQHDVVMLSDADEIVRADAFRWYIDNGHQVLAVPHLAMHYGRFDLRWTISLPQIARFFRGHELRDKTPEVIRRLQGAHVKPPLGEDLSYWGWHLSWMGGADAVGYKLANHAHPEQDTPETRARIPQLLTGELDLHGRRGIDFERVGLDRLPACVADLLHTDPLEDERDRWRRHFAYEPMASTRQRITTGPAQPPSLRIDPRPHRHVR